MGINVQTLDSASVQLYHVLFGRWSRRVSRAGAVHLAAQVLGGEVGGVFAEAVGPALVVRAVVGLLECAALGGVGEVPVRHSLGKRSAA